MMRRQELLRAAGNYASVLDYEKARAGRRRRCSRCPALLVIVDEFSELLVRRPEFMDLFVMIGRLGRSLGVHLLLASQRLEEGRMRGLESHLSLPDRAAHVLRHGEPRRARRAGRLRAAARCPARAT